MLPFQRHGSRPTEPSTQKHPAEKALARRMELLNPKPYTQNPKPQTVKRSAGILLLALDAGCTARWATRVLGHFSSLLKEGCGKSHAHVSHVSSNPLLSIHIGLRVSLKATLGPEESRSLLSWSYSFYLSTPRNPKP